MKKLILALVCGLPVWGVAGAAKFSAPANVQREANELIELDKRRGTLISPDSSCLEVGGGSLYDRRGKEIDGWKVAQYDCQGYSVMALSEILERNERGLIVRDRVVDVLATPFRTGLNPDEQPAFPLSWVSASDGYCNLDNNQKSIAFAFEVFLVWDKNGRAAGRKGQIKEAYRYDVKRQRIVPFDVKRLDCERAWFE